MSHTLYNSLPSRQQEENVATEELELGGHNIIIWNDDVNTFEWVIECLVDICKHSEEQAEQCAYLIHFQGKYAVKKGSFNQLKPQCEALIDRGLNATID